MPYVGKYHIKCSTPGCPLVATNFPAYEYCCKSCCKADFHCRQCIHDEQCEVVEWDPDKPEFMYEWFEFEESDEDTFEGDSCVDEPEHQEAPSPRSGTSTHDEIQDDSDKVNEDPSTTEAQRDGVGSCLPSAYPDNSEASVDMLAYARVQHILGGQISMTAAEYHHAFGPITSDAPFGMHVFTGLFDRLRREYCLFARHGWYFQQALQNAGQCVREGWFLKPEPFTVQQARLPRFSDDTNHQTWYPAMFIVDADDEAQIVTMRSHHLIRMACLGIVLMRSCTWLVHPDRIQLLSETDLRNIFQHHI